MASKKQNAQSPQREVPQVAVPRDDTSEANHPIVTAVDAFFKNDERVRTALSRNLKERGTATLKVADHVKTAFAKFSPSKYSKAERELRNFVPADENLANVMRDVVDRAVATISDSVPQRAMKVHLGVGLAKHIDNGAKGGKIALGDLMEYVSAKGGTSLTASTGTAFTKCRAEMEAEKRLKEIIGRDGLDDEDAALDITSGTDAAARRNALSADKLVSQQVQTQMSTATSPEEKLRFAVPARSDPKQTDQAIGNFELRAGPADVTSYHDFNNLQIAFEYVWTEIFDGRLAQLGQELYHEYVKLQEFVGAASEDRSIDTIDDLKQLMTEIRELAKLTNNMTPASLQPPGGSSAINTNEDFEKAVQVVLDLPATTVKGVGDVIKRIGDFVGDFFKAPQIKWSLFPGPLPNGGDLIDVQIQDNVAPAGVVEIEIQTGPNTHGWKGIHFTEFDASNKPKSTFWIANDPNDKSVWNTASYNRLPLYTGQVANSVLEFWREGLLTVHTPFYVLADLGEKLKERSRVTFTWMKD